MILLDTDHLFVFVFPESDGHALLSAKMRASQEEFATTIVCVEEQLRGWLAAINRKPDVDVQVRYYDRLLDLWATFRDWRVVRFDEQAAARFKALRSRKIRIGTQDLKIASIALTLDALLLSANLRDFQLVPGLRVESWLAG